MKVLSIALVLLLALPYRGDAYQEFTSTVQGQSVAFKWKQTPVRWFATNRGVPGVPAPDFQATVARAFSTWESVPTASISFQFVGFTSAEPFDIDNIPVLGFQNQPDLERVLGATGFVFDMTNGAIVESDIFFNAAFPWSTSAGGEPTRFDLQSVATHEIGHFLGLGHSALGETEIRPTGGRRVIASGAVMFPISFGAGVTLDRELQPDDIAGVSDLYPDGSFRKDTGAARGRVTKNGAGVLGAHVTAFNPRTGTIIGGFTLNRDGEFQIAGLTPGPHVIRVEPLDDGDLESFFQTRDPIDISFQPAFYEHLFVAPPGGVGERFAVTVRPK